LSKIKNFYDLECWQLARQLVNQVYDFTKTSQFKKDFELVGQIRRSAISIMANIAEGFHRNTDKEFLKFLDYSRSSLAETLSHSFIALDQKYIDQKEFEKFQNKLNNLGKKTNHLISYLNASIKTSKASQTSKARRTSTTIRTNKTSGTNNIK
jgi:four helix bundle protein